MLLTYHLDFVLLPEDNSGSLRHTKSSKSIRLYLQNLGRNCDIAVFLSHFGDFLFLKVWTIQILISWNFQLKVCNSKDVSIFINKKPTSADFWCARYIVGVFIVDFGHISRIVQLFPLLTLNKWIPTRFAMAFTLSWRRSLPYRNQSIHLLCKSMDWFLYDRDLRLERVKKNITETTLSRIRSNFYDVAFFFFCKKPLTFYFRKKAPS